MANLSLNSYSKLNLFLSVEKKLDNGKHSLQSLFCPIKFGDFLMFSPSQKIEIFGMDIPQEQNLIFKAATLLNKYRLIPKGIRIDIIKYVPEKAGLGGGSGDAGLALTTLNTLWGLNLPNEVLLELARELGSDIEIFIKNQNTLMLGNVLVPMELPKLYFVIISPKNIKCSTKEIFAANKNFSQIDQMLLLQASPTELVKIVNSYHNDLEETVLERYPALKKYVELPNPFADISYRMTGSGSSFFCAFIDKQRAIEQYDSLLKTLNSNEELITFTSSL